MSIEKKARLEELYCEKVRSSLMKKLNIKNVLAVPKLNKIVLNVGVKEAISDSKVIQSVEKTLTRIAGQKPVRTKAKRSIAGFKLREGMPIGVMVTLRARRMYEFLDVLLNVAIPKIRDFQGVTVKFDGRGNYNLGIKEWIIFPEVDYDVSSKIYGLNVSIHTTSNKNEFAKVLLEEFGMPFKKKA
ncbi:50S ribosomal protein L5 [bacterium]|jgi:large subunit ribosomal protein L5|nr:50S ribosomal protein L5 [bacterium]